MSLESPELDDLQPIDLDPGVDLDLDIPAKTEADDGEEITVISFGDDDDGDDGAENSEGWKKLREERRVLKQQLAEKDAKLQAYEAPVVEIGPKPTLADCDYDEEVYDAKVDAWKETKRKAEDAKAQTQSQQQAQQAEFEADKRAASEQRASLNLPDFDDTAAEVMTTLSPIQQTVLIQAAGEKAKLIYALGKSPAKLAELAKITNPIKFAVQVAVLEKGMKMTTQRRAPEPEQRVKGSAPISKGVDRHLEKLEAEANRTGDRTAVVQYRKQLKAKAA